MKEWERLVILLDDFRPNKDQDQFEWIFDKSRLYTTRSMYRKSIFRDVNNKRMSKIWKSRLPHKINIFSWLAIVDKLQTRVKKWKGSEKCILRGVHETSDHIFFDYFYLQNGMVLF